MDALKNAAASVAALLVGAGLLVALSPAADAGEAVQVTCGQVITTDTKLANDLVGCPRHGLVIGADDVTLDLNGHTIAGDGTPIEDCPEDEPCDVGIVNSALRDGTPFNGPGFDGVTIANGVVRDFTEVGIYVVGASNVVVSRMQTSRSHIESDGVHMIDCMHCRIEDSSASDYSVGFVVIGSHHLTIVRSVVSDNQFGGIVVVGSDHVEVSGNTVTGTPEGEGIVLIESERNLVRHKVVSGSFSGVGLVQSHHNRVLHNTFHHNRFVGTSVYGGDSNLIAKNTMKANGDGSEGGIHLLATEEGDGADNNELVANRLSANDGDGILVDAGQVGTVIERNVVRRNSDDGIDVASSSTTLFGNVLIRNGDLGIDAVPGVIDGGHNKGIHNGNPVECLNVVC